MDYRAEVELPLGAAKTERKVSFRTWGVVVLTYQKMEEED